MKANRSTFSRGGGNGCLQTMHFMPAENANRVEAYSPLLDEYRKEAPHSYVLDYAMTEAGEPAAAAGR